MSPPPFLIFLCLNLSWYNLSQLYQASDTVWCIHMVHPQKVAQLPYLISCSAEEALPAHLLLSIALCCGDQNNSYWETQALEIFGSRAWRWGTR